MATKPPKKKTGKSTARKSATIAKSAQNAAKKSAEKSTVIPFTPLSVAMTVPTAEEALRSIGDTMNINAPEFKTYYNAMETTMSNYKDQYEKVSSDASNYMRQNMEGYSQLGTSLMKGTEVMAKTYMEMIQNAAERNAASMKNLMACRTLHEAAEAQNKMIQSNLDETMSAATKLSEMAIKICTEACEPLNEQMTKAMSKMSA